MSHKKIAAAQSCQTPEYFHLGPFLHPKPQTTSVSMFQPANQVEQGLLPGQIVVYRKNSNLAVEEQRMTYPFELSIGCSSAPKLGVFSASVETFQRVWIRPEPSRRSRDGWVNKAVSSCKASTLASSDRTPPNNIRTLIN